MALAASEVRVGVTGAIYVAPAGTSVPTTVAGATTGFTQLGYVSEDGLVTSTSTDTNDIKAWQNGDLVRRVQTSHDYTLKFSMLQTNEKTLEVYYGNYTHGAGATDGSVQVTGEQGFRGAWVFDVIDDDQLIRITVPDGQVTEREDVSYVNGDAVTYGVTITCYPNASGVKATILLDTDAAS